MLVPEQNVTACLDAEPQKALLVGVLAPWGGSGGGRSFWNRLEPPVMLPVLGPSAISPVGYVPKTCSGHVFEIGKCQKVSSLFNSGEIGIFAAGVLVDSDVLDWAGRLALGGGEEGTVRKAKDGVGRGSV